MSNILPFIGKKFSENLANKIVRSEIDQFYYDLFIAPHDPANQKIVEPAKKGHRTDED